MVCLINLKHITKTFNTKDGDVHAVKDVSLQIDEGQIYGIIGFSGAGKSTLVRCINLLEKPEHGEVIFDGKDLLKITEKELRIERQKMGMIFQHFNLMKSRTVYENIAFPLRHLKMDKEQIDKRVMELLELIDLVERKDSYPSQLSGGQKQRVAIASAIASERPIILFDEPTSGLDLNHMRQVAEAINRLAVSGKTKMDVLLRKVTLLLYLHIHRCQSQRILSIRRIT